MLNHDRDRSERAERMTGTSISGLGLGWYSIALTEEVVGLTVLRKVQDRCDMIHLFRTSASRHPDCVAIALAACVMQVACGEHQVPHQLDPASVQACSDSLQTANFNYLATGSRSGAYVQLGDAIAKYTSETNLRVRACITKGSKENLHLLRTTSAISFALVQLDALHEDVVHRRSGPTDRNIWVVAYLYSEAVHLFVRPHLFLTSPADLGTIAQSTGPNEISDVNHVWLGDPQSGGYQTASRVLEAAGIPDRAIQRLGKERVDLNFDSAARCVDDSEECDADHELIAYFRTMAVPRPLDCQLRDRLAHVSSTRRQVETLLKHDGQIMALPEALVDRLTEDDLYTPATIPFYTYCGMKRGVATVGVPTLLVTNLPETPENHDHIRALIQAISEQRGTIENQIGIDLDLWGSRAHVERDRLAGIPIHTGASSHFQSPLPRLLWVCSFVLGLVMALMWRAPEWFRRRLAAGSYGLLLLAILCSVWVFVSLAMMQAEGTLNPEFSTTASALWRTLGIVSGQSKDYRLMTRQGQTWRWLGLFLFPVVLGWLMSDVVKDLLRRVSDRLAGLIRRAQAQDAHKFVSACANAHTSVIDWMRRRRRRANGPVIFLNWDDRAQHMIDDCRQDTICANREVVIVHCEGSEYLPTRDRASIRILEGDPAARETLEEAGLVNAAAVTILSAWSRMNPGDRRRSLDPDVADTKTILAILTIRALCEELHRARTLPIKAEIRLTRNQEAAKNAAIGTILDVTCLSV